MIAAPTFDWIVRETWQPRDLVDPAIGRVVFGRGCALGTLPAVLAAKGVARTLVVASRTLAATSDLVTRLATVLAPVTRTEMLASRAHSPSGLARAAADAAHALDADAIVVVGGSSATDLAKHAAFMLGQDGGETDGSIPPIYCIPTTLSGSEFSPAFAITNDAGVKRVSRSPSVLPRAVFLDPDMTVATPPELWAATGLKLLDHALGRVLSTAHAPLIDVQSVAGAALVVRHLRVSVAAGPDLASRREPLLTALWLVQSNAGLVGVGYSHALSRALSARNGVAHGIGSALFLVPVLRWCAPVAPERFTLIADALVPGAGPNGLIDAAIERVDQLVDELDLPRRLRDVGVSREDIQAIAIATLADPSVRTSPWQPQAANDLIERLEEIW